MNNPHDKIIKKMLRKKEFASHFFREYLPADIVSQLDWRRFRISKESFITSEFEDRFSDVIYETYIKGEFVFIYLLLEHQSTVDPWMPLRFLRYMLELWELYIAQHPETKTLPCIIPILLYHGKYDWDAKIQFQDLFSDINLMSEYVPKFKYLLKDFSPYSNEEIKGDIIIRLALMVLHHIFSPNFREQFEKMIPLFVELANKKTGMEYLLAILRYICEVSDALTINEIEDNLLPLMNNNQKGGIMTIAEQLRKEGKKEGRKEGILEEARDMVCEVLIVKFKKISNEIKGLLNTIADRNVLKSLHRQAVVCQDLPEFYESLNMVTAKSG